MKGRSKQESLTLDAKHEQIINEFKEQSNFVPDMKKKLTKMTQRFAVLSKKNQFRMEEKERTEKYNLEKSIQDLTEKIEQIESGACEIQYNLQALPHLYEYYNSTTTRSKADIHDDYMRLMDPDNAKSKKTDPLYWCKDCDLERELNVLDGMIICTTCGKTDEAIVEDSKQTYSDGMTPQENNYFSYKKITHFKECIDQCQGKERTEIPKEVFEKLLHKIKIERIEDRTKLTPEKVRQYLRELKFNKYYEHIPYILNKLGGQPPPEIPAHVEEQLIKMFNDVTIAFKKCCPKGRRNFLSYSYVLHKFIQIIGGYDHLLKYFKLPKSINRRQEIDEIWEKICKILDWPFYSSFKGHTSARVSL